MAVDGTDLSREQMLAPEVLLGAYARGWFPMADSRDDDRVAFYSSDPRAVMELDGLRVTRSLRQRVNSGLFEIRYDTAFDRVIRACSKPRPTQPETWINKPIVAAYCRLHELGHAHSVEAWREGRLVGGLYGVVLGGAFCGESMFSRPDLGGSDASKVCLYHLVQRLRDRGFVLLDVQMNSDHMTRMGAIDIPLDDYLARLEGAVVMDHVSWDS